MATQQVDHMCTMHMYFGKKTIRVFSKPCKDTSVMFSIVFWNLDKNKFVIKTKSYKQHKYLEN